ncbi:MAG: hypothetical protein KDA69_06275 [Planctomycetaceae bacterium]|nr:hypothetical protein [Planctomycetaceae bacterium]MCA9031086.1 hypothetical protein [Planctomycetaceae bacterium]MCA9043907.1 hypothetical protein [Planctomycetaceae bacterium]MCB9950418.1 hypothetical protein [Planctomycetaceae bacterium]
MVKWNGIAKRLMLLAGLAALTLPSSGCAMAYWFTKSALAFSAFWGTTPLIPVTPYFSQQIEDTYWEEERYSKVPILDPIEGENAPLFCLDPPSPDEVIRALPSDPSGGVPFLAETARNNVRMTVDLIVDRVDDCKVVPHVGPVRLHHCHYKCTVYFDQTIRSHWPVPFTHSDNVQDVVYIDHDHFIRCAGPDSTDITLDQIH